MRFPGFIGPSYTLQSVNVDCQRCVNLYPEINDLGTGKEREVASLVSTPGLSLLLTLSESPVRGLYTASNGEMYAVGGSKLYSISSSWVATELGSLNTSTGPVSMADNGTYLVLVDGTDGFQFNMSTDTFAEITDTEFYAADQVTYQDGYFLLNRKGTGQFFFVDDGSLNFDGADIATAEGKPDNLVGILSVNQNVHLFGTQSTEVFYNSGDASAPFQRIQGAVIAKGCAAAFSIGNLDGSPCWIGQDEGGFGIVYRLMGYQAVRISTFAVESVIRGVDPTLIGNARAWTYQQGGHQFYCLNLPGVNSTWVYDGSTGFWHERIYRGSWGQERHRAECHTVAYSKNVVGDYENGRIYSLDASVYTDNGTAIVRSRRAPHLSDDGKLIRYNEFRLDLETGVGLSGTGQGIDPQVIMRWSDDGGHTWSNEKWASMGKIGEYKKRARWQRLGMSRDRVYEVTTSEPVKTVFIGAELEVEEGDA